MKINLLELVQNWLEKTKCIKTSTSEIIEKCVSKAGTIDNQKSMEMKIAKCLKHLGWKKTKSSRNYWIKPDAEFVVEFDPN